MSRARRYFNRREAFLEIKKARMLPASRSLKSRRNCGQHSLHNSRGLSTVDNGHPREGAISSYSNTSFHWRLSTPLSSSSSSAPIATATSLARNLTGFYQEFDRRRVTTTAASSGRLSSTFPSVTPEVPWSLYRYLQCRRRSWYGFAQRDKSSEDEDDRKLPAQQRVTFGDTTNILTKKHHDGSSWISHSHPPRLLLLMRPHALPTAPLLISIGRIGSTRRRNPQASEGSPTRNWF